MGFLRLILRTLSEFQARGKNLNCSQLFCSKELEISTRERYKDELAYRVSTHAFTTRIVLSNNIIGFSRVLVKACERRHYHSLQA